MQRFPGTLSRWRPSGEFGQELNLENLISSGSWSPFPLPTFFSSADPKSRLSDVGSRVVGSTLPSPISVRCLLSPPEDSIIKKAPSCGVISHLTLVAFRKFSIPELNFRSLPLVVSRGSARHQRALNFAERDGGELIAFS